VLLPFAFASFPTLHSSGTAGLRTVSGVPDAIPSSSPDDAWSGDRVTRWLRQAAHLERQMAPVSEQLFALAAVQPGEAVLDVGCGAGPTTREAATLAGPTGQVSGLDVSAQMLDAAAEVGPQEGAAPIEWIEADAVSWNPPEDSYDLVLSRFGVMFFTDPPAALANLAAATRDGGRFAAAVWGRRTESPLFELPYRIALDVRHAHGQDIAELAPDEGPFAWHDADAVTQLLEDAGWHDVAVVSHLLRLPFGGHVVPAAAAAVALDFGPTRLVMQGADPQTIASVQQALAVAFGDEVDEDGHVVLEATIRLVTARR
jgi:SAM-dependent methyltransferase